MFLEFFLIKNEILCCSFIIITSWVVYDPVQKVSRVMSQAARLNEAFTEVRRVPVIRPALPSPGAWPVLSLR